MEAFVVVKDHPFFSATDTRGNYEIKDVPLGKVRVEIWYPNLDVRSDNIEIVRDERGVCTQRRSEEALVY